MRVNPFSVQTDASTVEWQYLGETISGRPEIYEGNRGILEIWKTFGPDNYDGKGNRQFKKVWSQVNEPVGIVPKVGFAPRATPRIYRGAWNVEPDFHRDPRLRSNITGGIGADDGYMFIGTDCIYIGDEELHGTGFRDVNPGQLEEP